MLDDVSAMRVATESNSFLQKQAGTPGDPRKNSTFNASAAGALAGNTLKERDSLSTSGSVSFEQLDKRLTVLEQHVLSLCYYMRFAHILINW